MSQERPVTKQEERETDIGDTATKCQKKRLIMFLLNSYVTQVLLSFNLLYYNRKYFHLHGVIYNKKLKIYCCILSA